MLCHGTPVRHGVLGRLAPVCRRLVAPLGALAAIAGLTLPAVAVTDVVAPAPLAGATNGYGPGIGPKTPGLHWGGAEVPTCCRASPVTPTASTRGARIP